MTRQAGSARNRAQFLCVLSLALLMIFARLSVSEAAASASAKSTIVTAERPSQMSWCGESAALDWVCRWRGAVFSEGDLLPKRVARVAEKSLTTGPSSEARVSFRGQANCTISESSQIYPRDGAPNSLFSQQYGSSSCSSRTGGSAVRLLCGPSEPCPAEVRVKGTILLAFPSPSSARASFTETHNKRVRIVLCAGSMKVITAEGDEAAGGASGTNRYVLVVEEQTVHTTEEGLEESGGSISIRVVGTLAGPGDCAKQTIEAQENTRISP